MLNEKMLLHEKLRQFHTVAGCYICVHRTENIILTVSQYPFVKMVCCWKKIDRKVCELTETSKIFCNDNGKCKLKEERIEA